MAAWVLVVEDDPTMAEVLLAYLGRAGYRMARADELETGAVATELPT